MSAQAVATEPYLLGLRTQLSLTVLEAGLSKIKGLAFLVSATGEGATSWFADSCLLIAYPHVAKRQREREKARAREREREREHVHSCLLSYKGINPTMRAPFS